MSGNTLKGPKIAGKDEYYPYPADATPHRIYQAKENEKIIVIGDVHGCLTELKDLLEKCQYKKGESTVIFVGDLVNAGPHSAEVVRFVMNEGFLSVKGNHEDSALYVASRREAMRNKGEDPNEVKELFDGRWVDELTSEEKLYLASLPFTMTVPKYNTIIVHAGFVPTFPIDTQDHFVMYSLRNLEIDNTDPENPKYTPLQRDTGGVPWASVWPGPEHVIFGHDATRKLQQYPYATGIDTGCVYGFHLTACILPERELVQVNATKQWKEVAPK